MARYQIILRLAGLPQPTARPQRNMQSPARGWAANSNHEVDEPHGSPIWTGDGFGADWDDSRWVCRSID